MLVSGSAGMGVRAKRGGGKKACLVQEPFNNFLWKLKKEIVWGRIAGGGRNEAHMNSRWKVVSRDAQRYWWQTQTKLFRNRVCVCLFGGWWGWCLWGHLPNSCFQHFLLTYIFLLCSLLIVSIPARRESLRNVLSAILLRFLNYIYSPSLRVKIDAISFLKYMLLTHHLQPPYVM